MRTEEELQEVSEQCKKVFIQKMKNYGLSWKIMRLSSITDLINIKSLRIRTLEETKVQMVNEGIDAEYVGVVNYCIMGLILMEFKNVDEYNALKHYEAILKNTFDLISKKNHDYGEAWRSMRITSITDQLLVRILRIKELENQPKSNLIEEQINSNYYDMLNYSLFALIKLKNNG